MKEELIDYANKNYPKGTFYISADATKMDESDSDVDEYSAYVKGKLYHYDDGAMITDGHGGYVYFNGNWAVKRKTLDLHTLIKNLLK